MIHEGDRYSPNKSLEVIAMTSWAAPYTGGSDGILPAGEEFTVSHPPREGATAVYCDPVNYDKLHAHFVPVRDRKNRRYSGYYLCVPIEHILADCTRIGQSPTEPQLMESLVPQPRPWESDRQQAEADGAIPVLVRILDRGEDDYRLVPAEEVGPMTLRLGGEPAPGEVWEYQPGDVVRCLVKVFEAGPGELLAIERVEG